MNGRSDGQTPGLTSGGHRSLEIMPRVCTTLFLAALLCSCSTGSGSLGHGYRLVPRSVDMRGVPGAFEGTAHYLDLYYRSLCLGTVGQHSISPSGRFALFEDSGRLLDTPVVLPLMPAEDAFA